MKPYGIANIRIFRVAVLILFIGTFSLSSIYAQESFYYYKDQKIPLRLNKSKLHVVSTTESSRALEEELQGIARVSGFGVDDAAKTLNIIDQEEAFRKQFWARLELEERDYEEVVKILQEDKNIKQVSPFFKTRDGFEAGLSHYFMVKVKEENDVKVLFELAQKHYVSVVGQNRFMPQWYTLKCTEKTKLNALELANLFYETGQFIYAEPDLMVDDESFYAPNDPLYNTQWGLENTGQNGGTPGIDINAEDAWDISKGSRDVVVAVLDHGFEMNHPDLDDNVFGTGFDSESGTTPAQVLGPHGTACAGIVAAVGDNNTGISGVAPSAQLMSISNSLAGTPNSRQRRADGINWAYLNGADIISNSWFSGVQYAIIDDAIDDALDFGRGGLGTIMVFAAGNFNGAVSYPANANPDIIAVGAMSPCAERKSPTSCDGEGWGSNFGSELDIMAPGVLIQTTDQVGGNGYIAGNYEPDFNGTSSACPAVAGVAALVLSVNPCLTHDEVEDIIEQSGQKVGTYLYSNFASRPNGTWNMEMGYGLVDAETAVLLAQSLLPASPTFDLYSKDRPFDTGIEANPDAGPMWISEDIWVRKNLDGGTTHQNPEFKNFAPNGLYVRVRNRGSQASDCANLSVYFSKASTGLNWPNHWNNYSIAGVLHGDKINTVSIPSIPAGGSVVIEIPWYPPNPADFSTDIHHFCLLSRIESDADPMFFEQNGVGVGVNVRNNNNIAWKNISVYDNDADSFASVFIRPTFIGWNTIRLRFWDQGFKEKIDGTFFERGGKALVLVDPKFFKRIQGADLKGIKIVDENLLYIASRNAEIRNLKIHSRENFVLGVQFEVPELQVGESVPFDILQFEEGSKRMVGGERFIIQKSKKRVNPFPDFGLDLDLGDGIKIIDVFPNPTRGFVNVKYDVEQADSPVQLQSV